MAASGYAGYRARMAEIESTSMTTTDALREALALEIAEAEKQRTPFFEWSLRVPEPKAGTLNFERFPFQKELYRESAGDKDLCIKKATQLGVSAFLVRWTLYWADTKGLTALYVFPTRNDVYDFSDARIKPAIESSEYLRDRIPPGYVQNKGLKAIGLGFVYFRGSETKRGLDSVDADILAMDEYDTLVQENIGDAERRISGSLVGLIRRVGVPSINDFGISREFDRSDQRRWYVKCGACGEQQYLAFNNLEWNRAASQAPYDAHLICRKCAKPRLDVLQGEWVAKHPDRTMRGYHMPRLIVGHTDLDKIVHASKEREPYKRQVHFNKDLAEPWEGEGGRLTRNEIKAAQREDVFRVSGYDGDNLVTMGVDVASVRSLNVWISEHLSERQSKVLWVGKVDSFTDLAKLMDRYRVKMACIDHLPEHRLARAVEEKYPGRVYLVRYASQAQNVIDVNDEMATVSVRRTEAIDAAIERIRAQRCYLPMDLPEEFVGEMCSVVRRVERDELDKVKVDYVKTDDDDTLQACVYDVIATESWWIRQQADDADREVLQPLDDMLDFERSGLHDPDEVDYSAGPGEGDYAMGPTF